MTIFSTAFMVFIVLGLAALAFALLSSIISNLKVGQRYRDKLMERLSHLPINKMLNKRDIDVNKYLHTESVVDIENQLQKCDGCSVREECEDTLEGETKPDADYSFCPNDEDFKVIKFSENESGNDKPVY